MKAYIECSVCRESDDSPWCFYIDFGGENVHIFDVDKTGLFEALRIARTADDHTLMTEVYDTFVYAACKNATHTERQGRLGSNQSSVLAGDGARKEFRK